MSFTGQTGNGPPAAKDFIVGVGSYKQGFFLFSINLQPFLQQKSRRQAYDYQNQAASCLLQGMEDILHFRVKIGIDLNKFRAVGKEGLKMSLVRKFLLPG